MVLEVRMSRPHPQTGLDRMMVLEVGDESAPPPTPPPSQPERHPNFNPSYIISALCASPQHIVTTYLSPASMERRHRRTFRPRRDKYDLRVSRGLRGRLPCPPGCGLRGRASFLNIPLRVCRLLPLSLCRLPLGLLFCLLLLPTRSEPRVKLLPFTLLFGLFLCLAPVPVQHLLAIRGAGFRRRIGVAELLSAGLVCASTPPRFSLFHGVVTVVGAMGYRWGIAGIVRNDTPRAPIFRGDPLLFYQLTRL